MTDEIPTHGAKPGPAHGAKPGPAHGAEPGPAHGAEPGPTHGAEPGPTHGAKPGPAHGAKPGPAHGAEPGPAHGAEPGPAHGAEPGRTDLLEAAETARGRAYAPYSRFQVGAAVRAASGAIYAAGNVENAAYPVGTCAEAGAIAAMIAGGDRVIVEVMVTGPGPAPITPCGACRQRIREFAAPETLIHAGGPKGVTASFTLDALLPEAFGPDNLTARVAPY